MVLVAETKVLEFTKLPVVVATLPFTVEVRVKLLLEVEIVRVLEVEEETRLERSTVEVATPLITVVKLEPEVVTELEVMMEVVAETPFTVEVRTLPVTDWVKELIKEITAEEIPFRIEVKVLVVVEILLEVMMEEVEMTPFTEEVATLPPTVKELELITLAEETFPATLE
jgi:hypothetical protein